MFHPYFLYTFLCPPVCDLLAERLISICYQLRKIMLHNEEPTMMKDAKVVDIYR